MCLSMRCSLQHHIFHSVNYWLAVWLLEPDYLGWNSGPATYWLCDPRRVINFSCLSIFLCEMETIMVPGSYNYVRIDILGTSLVVQWLRLCPSSVGDASSIPGWGTKIPYAPICGPKKLLYHNCLIC